MRWFFRHLTLDYVCRSESEVKKERKKKKYIDRHRHRQTKRKRPIMNHLFPSENFSSNSSRRTLFEKLPDELLLNICRYLSPIEVLDGFFDLNQRLTRTITFYRENIFLSNLTKSQFDYFVKKYLIRLAPSVRCLIIDNRSTDQLGKRFEMSFKKIDQEFSQLERLIFYRIDIETLEDLSWRFNSMSNLRYLEVDISPDRLRMMPIGFNAFLCGKFFSSSIRHENLVLTFDEYAFSLNSLKNSCPQLRYLTITIKSLVDLWTIFDCLPNLQELNVTITCSTIYENSSDVYPYDRLWWKLPQFKIFQIKLEQKHLYRYENLLSSDVLFKIIKNLHSLIEVKFSMNIEHENLLRSQTTKEKFLNIYLPFIDGHRWQNALERDDNRNIHLEFHLELDGFGSLRPKVSSESEQNSTNDENAIDFHSLIIPTFSNAFWLERNFHLQFTMTTGGHYSIYTKPITSKYLTTTIRMIEQDFNLRPSFAYRHVQYLNLFTSVDPFPPNLSLKNLCEKFPFLKHLSIDTNFDLSTTNSMISTRLQSLTISKTATTSFRQLLDYLPHLKIFSIENLTNHQLSLNIDQRSIVSIRCLKIVISQDLFIDELFKFIKILTNLNEFYLTIRYSSAHSPRDIQPYLIFENILSKFERMRYIETTFEIKHDIGITYVWKNHSKVMPIEPTVFSDGNIFRLKIWF